MVGDI